MRINLPSELRISVSHLLLTNSTPSAKKSNGASTDGTEKKVAAEDGELESGEIPSPHGHKRAGRREDQPVTSAGSPNPAPDGGKRGVARSAVGEVVVRGSLADGAAGVRLEGEKKAMSGTAMKGGKPGPEVEVEETVKPGNAGKAGKSPLPSRPGPVTPQEKEKKTMADIVQETVRDKLSRRAERNASLANPRHGGEEPGSPPAVSPSPYDCSSHTSSPIFYYDL